MRYPAEQKAETRGRILAEAANAIRAGGIDRLGVAAVMRRAGLTHGGFYAHFTSRDDLIDHAIEQMFDDRYAAFFSHLHTVEPRAVLNQFLDRYLSMAHRDAPERGCPIPTLAGHAAHLPDRAREHFAEATRRLTEGVNVLLDRATLQNDAGLGDVIVSELVGAVVMARLQPDREQAARLLDDVRTAIHERLDRLAAQV